MQSSRLHSTRVVWTHWSKFLRCPRDWHIWRHITWGETEITMILQPAEEKTQGISMCICIWFEGIRWQRQTLVSGAKWKGNRQKLKYRIFYLKRRKKELLWGWFNTGTSCWERRILPILRNIQDWIVKDPKQPALGVSRMVWVISRNTLSASTSLWFYDI